MTLDQVLKGKNIRIISIMNKIARAQALRFGIGEGSIVFCREMIPAGPVILQKNQQEIAIGRGLAQSIIVETV